MNTKKIKLNKFLSNLMTILLILAMFNACVYAAEPPQLNGEDEVTAILTEVLQVLLTVAGFVCVGKLIHIGILYMTSSVVDKSNAKAAVLPWIIGTVVCFGAAWIGGAIIGILRIDGDVLNY